MNFPNYRLRRLRRTETLRRMVRETKLSVDDFVMPFFVVHGRNVKKPIPSMPGHFQLSVDNIVKEVKIAVELGVPGVILFGIPEKKDEIGTSAYADNGVVQQAVRALKKEFRELCVITDVCMCEYTDHGHCGIVEKGYVLNDPTLELLAKEAVSHARAGADMVAPSDMMDGRVGFIREELDEAGFENIPILSYSVKYASAFYGPFREAAESAPKFGDRKTYQMDPANSLEALREASLDIEEGADIIMVKPAMPYLDVIKMLREEFDYPVAAYQVSGEFAMIKASAERGWLEHDRTMLETLTAIKRAGADIIITYFAVEAARLLK